MSKSDELLPDSRWEGVTKATATIRDVAREAAVSVASASRALNGHANVTQKTRERVLAAATKLDYVPHSGARSLTMARTHTIGVVLPDLFGEFFSEIIRGIDRVAHQGGLQLLLANMHDSPHETALAIRTMRGRVDGLMVMAPNVDAAFLEANLPRGLPTVVLNGHFRGVGHASLSIDNAAGARAMVEHLVNSGRRRIAHIAGPRGNCDGDERREGFRAAMRELAGEGDPVVFDGDFSEESGHAAGKEIARLGTLDAVFAANDVMAIGCMAALSAAGVSVPSSVAVAGFDDVPIARYVTPTLTTMRVHIAELGVRAYEKLSVLLLDPEADLPEESLVPELVVRRSTGG